MRIRCWGARGSIPVSGPEHVKYGGDTTCLELTAASGDIVIVDCGSGIRRLGNRLVRDKVERFSVLFTHSHWDHILGFPFFKPLYAAGTRADFYGCPFAQRSIRDVIAKVMEAPRFPVDMSMLKAELRFQARCASAFRIGSLDILPVRLSHPNQGLGFKFSEAGKTFVFLTDNELRHAHPGGLRFSDYADFCSGADVLFHDAEFTEPEYGKTKGWGHSTWNQALELALAAGVKKFGLFHHNHDRDDAGVDALVADCRRAAGSRLECFGVTQETVLEL